MTVAMKVFLIEYVLIEAVSCLRSTKIQNIQMKLYHFAPLTSISLSSKETHDVQQYFINTTSSIGISPAS